MGAAITASYWAARLPSNPYRRPALARQPGYAVGVEAATRQRSLTGPKAARMVEAMRESVAVRGTAGSTFDHVARAAGVSRGLLHYYFGTKERLLVEVVRHDCEVRHELLETQLAGARTAEDFIDRLVHSLEKLVRDDPAFMTLLFELFTLARRNEEIRAEFAELLRRQRMLVADLLRDKEIEGVLHLSADPEAVVDVLFSLAEGFALRMLTDDQRAYAPTIEAGVACVRTLLADAV